VLANEGIKDQKNQVGQNQKEKGFSKEDG